MDELIRPTIIACIAAAGVLSESTVPRLLFVGAVFMLAWAWQE